MVTITPVTQCGMNTTLVQLYQLIFPAVQQNIQEMWWFKSIWPRGNSDHVISQLLCHAENGAEMFLTLRKAEMMMTYGLTDVQQSEGHAIRCKPLRHLDIAYYVKPAVRQRHTIAPPEGLTMTKTLTFMAPSHAS